MLTGSVSLLFIAHEGRNHGGDHNNCDRHNRDGKLEHRVREPACTFNMVPELANQSLPSRGKNLDDGYVLVCNGDEVNIYYGRTATITVSEDAVLKGWQCPRTKLWWIPLLAQVTDLNIHTLLIDVPTGSESLNSLYTFLTTASVLSHTESLNSNQAVGCTINNVYDLPSLACAVHYLHAATGFPTKVMCLKSIRNSNYLTLEMLTIHNVNRHLPESEETQKGHMQNQRQGVRSTKAKAPHPGTESPPAEKKRDVFINLYEPKYTMYTYQTGKFPHRSIRRNRYQMIPHEIDVNSTWIEPMKNKIEATCL